MRQFWGHGRMRGLTVVVVVTASLGATEPAWAYLDPGTGSLILQAIIGVFVAVSATAGIYWQKVKSLIASVFGRSKDKPSDDRRQVG